jgi:hypothetical protein
MKRKLLLSIAMAMCYYTATSQTVAVTKFEIDALKAHSKEIMEEAGFHAVEATMLIHMQNNVLRKDEQRLARYIREREIRKCCYDYIFPDSLKHRVVNKMCIDEFYADSINSILIAANNPYVSGENVTFAFPKADVLCLTEAQRDSIMEHALDFSRRIRHNPRLDVWDMEMRVLTKVLSTKQLDKFFYIKYSSEVNRKVDNCWKRLAEAGLAEELDSTQEVVKARMYYSLQHKISDIFRNNVTARQTNLSELGKEMPQMVRLFEALDKRKKTKIENEKILGKEFVW